MFTLNEYLNNYMSIPEEISDFEEYFAKKVQIRSEIPYQDLAWSYSEIKAWTIRHEKKLGIWRNEIRQEFYDYMERYEDSVKFMKQRIDFSDNDYEEMVCRHYYYKLYMEYTEEIFKRTLIKNKFLNENLSSDTELSYNEGLFVQSVLDKNDFDIAFRDDSKMSFYKDEADELFDTYIQSNNRPGM